MVYTYLSEEKLVTFQISFITVNLEFYKEKTEKRAYGESESQRVTKTENHHHIFRNMMEYQKVMRNRQVERTKKLLVLKNPKEVKKIPNDVIRFFPGSQIRNPGKKRKLDSPGRGKDRGGGKI